MKCIKFFVFVILLAFTLTAGDNFNLVKTWHPGDEVAGRYAFAIINDDGNIIATFYMSGNRVITPEKIIKFAPRGQGPGDLTDMQALFHYKEDIAFVERPEKVKVFKKVGETYEIKEILWLKRGKTFHFIKNGLFLDNKWFLAGFEMLDFDKKKEIQYISHLKIYDEKGKPLKSLIKQELNKPGRLYELTKYLVDYNPFSAS
ncbi:MAG: hypothetical protein KAW12_31390, partial [Candidatus Aminicenantes bacterium]|nr:hypothetical protein [Candidatus Aminicenantes bacterium]